MESLLSTKQMSDLKARKPFYVMEGLAEKKELSTYHLILAPTHACNLRCKHCYLPDHYNDLMPKGVVMNLIEEWSTIVSKERGQYGGIFHVKGGEPFVIPYLWDVADKLCELKTLRLMLTTNGTFVGDEVFDRLSHCKNQLNDNVFVIVSLDGATEETHSILRGKGHYYKTLEFLRGLQKKGITCYLNCVLHRGNIEELSEYVNLAIEYGASQINFLTFVPKGIGASAREFQVPHIEVYHRLTELYNSMDENVKDLIAGSLPYIKFKEATGSCCTSKECVAAYRGLFYIMPEGDVFTCPNITRKEYSVGNIYNQNLFDITNNLKGLYEKIKSHNAPYTCMGEKLLYANNNDIENLQSLNTLEKELEGIKNKTDYSKDVSYCYSRNF